MPKSPRHTTSPEESPVALLSGVLLAITATAGRWACPRSPSRLALLITRFSNPKTLLLVWPPGVALCRLGEKPLTEGQAFLGRGSHEVGEPRRGAPAKPQLYGGIRDRFRVTFFAPG